MAQLASSAMARVVLAVLLGASCAQGVGVGKKGGGVRDLLQMVQSVGSDPSIIGIPAQRPLKIPSMAASALMMGPSGLAPQEAAAPTSGSDIALPLAFFPFADNDLGSLIGTFTGMGMGMGITFQYDSDTDFDVLQCSQDENSSVVLPPIMYGQSGGWAINLWIKNLDGAAEPEAVFSQRSRQANNTIESVWGPDQVYLYFPGLAAPWNGLLRAVVKDDNDVFNGVSSVTYLDSDGMVSFSTRNTSNSKPPAVNLADGRWHMLTLTTFTGGGAGFQMYVDGILRGQMLPGRSYSGSDGYLHQTTGGGPMEVDGDIFLCSDGGRQDGVRGFDGRLAELAIWDNPLSSAQIGVIYAQGIRRKGTAPAPAPTPATEDTLAEETLANALGLEIPVAFFPLTGQSLQADTSFGGGKYSGQGYNITWANDESTGSVVQCNRAADSMVVLDPVVYGRQGPWAINLWFKADPGGLYGTQFEYLYSHSNANAQYLTGWEANQLAHPAFGVIRALVKDSTDNTTSLAGQTFLDSDGMVSQLVRNTTSPALNYGADLLQSGDWHMITLTTLQGDSMGAVRKGVAMYVDGQLAAEMNGSVQYLDAAGDEQQIVGGEPMMLTGNIFLCGRSTGDATRGYSGRLAELAIWKNALTAPQILAIFQQGLGNSAAAPAAGPSVLQTTVNGQVVCLLKPITVLPMQGCARSEVCVAISAAAIQEANLPTGVQVGDVGVCQLPLSGGLLLPNAATVPPARVFYPLTDVYTSYPLQDEVVNTTAVLSVPDSTFLYASYCSRNALSIIELPAVPYASAGPFSVNFWFKAENVTGAIMEYLYSQAGGHLDSNEFGPSQVQVYFPQDEHPAFGIVRTYVTDASDNTTTMVYLDSDGRVDDNMPRATVDSSNTSNSPTSNQPIVSDGQWHQITVTSQPDGLKGFRIYVDGELGGEITSADPPKDANGTTLPVTGGGPIDTKGPYYMCTREDDDPERHFDGLVAYLGLYDFALEQDQVMALNSAVTSPSSGIAPASSATSSLRTEDGQPCEVPTDAQGRPLWSQCPSVNGQPACPVQGAGQWEPCAATSASAPASVSAAPPAPASGITSVSGQQCELPLLYEGEAVYGCVTFALANALPVCWTAGGTWEQCAAPATASISKIPVVNAQQRVTSTGEQCGLPIVYQGVILTDCVVVAGSQACPSSNGVWSKCASRTDITDDYAPIIVAQPSDVTITNRTTVSGESCRLPVVSNGTIMTDCVYVNGSSQCMGNSSRSWEQCAPSNTPPGRESLPVVVQNGSVSDGASGSLCMTATSAGHGCQAGLVCIPLPVQVPVAVTTLYTVQPVSDVGYCMPATLGYSTLVRALQPISTHEVPQPHAFFPLVGGNLNSATLPQYYGAVSNGSWVPDSWFDQVLQCSKESQTSIKIQPVSFAASGAWTVNIWFKWRPRLSDRTNEALGYIMSLTGANTTTADASLANQIQVYLPGKQNTGYGVVRTIVKDSEDGPSSGNPAGSFVFLDSDGLENGNASGPIEVNPNDGNWHMATLSSQPENFAGYRLFVDGQLAGELSGNSTSATGSDPVEVALISSLLQISGGAPIYLTNPIILCARSDLDPNRYLDGSLAHLALYNTALSNEQVELLYDAYTTGPNPSPAVSPAGTVEQVSAQGGGKVTSSGRSDAGTIAGGILGALAGLTIVGLLVFFVIRRRRRSRFVPFKDAPMMHNQSSLSSFGSSEVEMRPAPRIEKIEDNGFGGNRPVVRTPFVDQAEEILKDTGSQGAVHLPADSSTQQLHPTRDADDSKGADVASNGKAKFLSDGPKDAENFESRPSLENTLLSNYKEA